VDRAYHVVVGSLGPVPLASVRAALRSRWLKKLRGPMFKVVKYNYNVDTNGVELTRKAISVEELENSGIRMTSVEQLMSKRPQPVFMDGNSMPSGQRGDYLHAVFCSNFTCITTTMGARTILLG
jgi:hypothetical protein